MSITITKPSTPVVTAESWVQHNRAEELRDEITILEERIKLLEGREFSEHRDEFKHQLRALHKEAKILNAGFEPATVNTKWHSGFLTRPRFDFTFGAGLITRGRTYINGVYLYRDALPPEAMEAYQRAKSLNIFDEFTVHSPEIKVFKRPNNTFAVMDPILLGWTTEDKGNLFNQLAEMHQNSGGKGYNSGFVPREATAWFIAAWDMAKDLAPVLRRVTV